MNPAELYEFLLNTIQPKYEKEFGIERRKDIMNVSSLVGGTASYLYHWRQHKIVVQPKLSIALLRGKAIHDYLSSRLDDKDKHEITWKLPYDWKDGTKDITLLGHYDNVIPVADDVLAEWKSTEQDSPTKNGLLLRAKRQNGTYGTILRLKTGINYECFICILNVQPDKMPGFVKLPTASDVILANPRCVIVKLSPDEMREGWEFVRRTAYEVARVLDIVEGETKQ